MQLAELLARHIPRDGVHTTAIPFVRVHRRSSLTAPAEHLLTTRLGLVVQGEKRLVVGGERRDLQVDRYFVASSAVPVTGQVTRASRREPYLALMMDLDRRRLSELLGELGTPQPPPTPLAPALASTPLDAPMRDALLRLLRLLDAPADIPALAPAIEREILYRLLTSEHGPLLRRLASAADPGVLAATRWIEENYAAPLAIGALARRVHMSVSSLHHRFKAQTGTTPLQYQKQLRLREARRLMLAEGLDAARAAYAVGYRSASHFSRDYRRAHAAPPRAHVAWLGGRLADDDARPALAAEQAAGQQAGVQAG